MVHPFATPFISVPQHFDATPKCSEWPRHKRSGLMEKLAYISFAITKIPHVYISITIALL